MAHDREVGGIRCLEVLAHLSEYVDGDAGEELRARIEAHLEGCDWCERFGGRFSETIGDLRRHLGSPGDVDEAVEARLFDRLGLGEDPDRSS